MPFVCVKPWDPKKKQKKNALTGFMSTKQHPQPNTAPHFLNKFAHKSTSNPPPHRPSEKHARPPDHYGGKTSPYVQH